MTSTGTPAAYWSAPCTGDETSEGRPVVLAWAPAAERGELGTARRAPAGDVLEWVGTFHAAGCVSSRAGTERAVGDRNPVPDGVECPRRYRNVPDGAGCPRLRSQAVLEATRPRRCAGCTPSPPLSRTSTTPPEAGNVQNGDKGRDEAENKERKPHDSAVQVMVRASGYPLCHRFGHAAGRTGSRSRAGAGGRARCRC